jgi:GDPmannose 4,6-dehydratase
MKKVLITGITGQDGSYLAEFLLKKGYEVYGMHRRTSMDIFERIGDMKDKISIVDGDITDLPSLVETIKKINPDEVYNLAAQSFVPASWSQPVSTGEITGLGVLRILEAIRLVNPKIKFYQASSSEMFGKVKESPQTEDTPFYPRSPYAVAKVYGYWITKHYREAYGIFACNGILFNHESPKRGKQFVTRKITHSVAKIKLGYQKCFSLGNLSAKRDWGHAEDYVRAMWMMMQQKVSDDYVISSDETHTVRDFVNMAFDAAGMSPIEWDGEGLNEVGKYNGEIVVNVDPKFYRPAEVQTLLGNSSKAKNLLGWTPKIPFKQLVKDMVEKDIRRLKERGLQETDK